VLSAPPDDVSWPKVIHVTGGIRKSHNPGFFQDKRASRNQRQLTDSLKDFIRKTESQEEKKASFHDVWIA
jgi:hypothetical protein